MSSIYSLVVTSGPRVGDIESGAVASLTSARFSMASGGLACVAGTVAIVAAFPELARWARVPGRVKPHGRFFYWGYWSGVRPLTTRSKMWLLDPDCAYTFPMEDDLTVVLVGPHRERLPEFRADLEGGGDVQERDAPGRGEGARNNEDEEGRDCVACADRNRAGRGGCVRR